LIVILSEPKDLGEPRDADAFFARRNNRVFGSLPC